MLKEASVSVKTQQLSKKEQEAKQRLLQGRQSKPSTPKKSKPIIQNKQNSSIEQIPKEQMDNFLKEIDKDFKSLSQNQITMEILTNQQQSIRHQNDNLSENQKQLSRIMDNSQNRSNIVISNEQDLQNKKQELYDANVSMMRSLLQPIHQQLKEIKQLHDQTQRASINIKNQLSNEFQQNPIKMNDGINQFNQQSTQLRGMLDTAQHNLTFLQPENLMALQNFQNFNLQVYSDTIQNLQTQILALQTKQDDVEGDINIKYKQLNDVRTNHKISNHRDTTYLELVDRVSQVDLIDRNRKVQEKLGGEFDYSEFLASLSDQSSRAQEIVDTFKDQGRQYEIDVPEFPFDEKDFQIVKTTSILDEMKILLGIETKQPQKNQQKTGRSITPIPDIRPQQDISRISGNEQRKNTKPPSIQQIITKPVQAIRDIKYQKEIPSRQLDSFMDAPEFKVEEPYIQEIEEPIQRIQEKPNQINRQVGITKTNERVKQPIKSNSQQKKNYGVIYQVAMDQSIDEQSDDEPLWTIQMPNIITKNKNQQSNTKEVRRVEPQQFNQEAQQDSNPWVEKPKINDPIPSSQQVNYEQLLTGQRQVDSTPGFLNYDNLMNQMNQDYYPQEQKSEEVMRRLGLRSENQQDSLIQQITNDIVRGKMQTIIQQKQVNKPLQVSIDQSTSPIFQPLQGPSVQEQANEGANALVQGLVQALVNTFAQINQGLFTSIQEQMPINLNTQQNLDSSEYSDSPNESAMKIKQPPKTILGGQYTFASDFNPHKMKAVDVKEYYKQFQEDSGSPSVSHNNSSINRSNRSQFGSNIFNTDPTPKQSQRTSGPLTKDIFKGLDEDLS